MVSKLAHPAGTSAPLFDTVALSGGCFQNRGSCPGHCNRYRARRISCSRTAKSPPTTAASPLGKRSGIAASHLSPAWRKPREQRKCLMCLEFQAASSAYMMRRDNLATVEWRGSGGRSTSPASSATATRPGLPRRLGAGSCWLCHPAGSTRRKPRKRSGSWPTRERPKRKSKQCNCPRGDAR